MANIARHSYLMGKLYAYVLEGIRACSKWNLDIKAEWLRKSNEYHLCQDNLELCNQEFARVMFDALSK